jgi:hypothetical protein
MFPMFDQDAETPRAPSREEVENLCLLCSIARSPCSFEELAERLGLCRELGPAMGAAVEALVSTSRAQVADGILSITAEGREWLRSRLFQLECDSAVSPRPPE